MMISEVILTIAVGVLCAALAACALVISRLKIDKIDLEIENHHKSLEIKRLKEQNKPRQEVINLLDWLKSLNR